MAWIRIYVRCHSLDGNAGAIQEGGSAMSIDPQSLGPAAMAQISASVPVLYLCDRKKCDNCTASIGFCFLTTDITHAANFREIGGAYIEIRKEDS